VRPELLVQPAVTALVEEVKVVRREEGSGCHASESLVLQGPGRQQRHRKAIFPGPLVLLLLAGGLFGPRDRIRAQEAPGPASALAAEGADGAHGPLDLAVRELKIYADDSKAIFLAPFHWNADQAGLAIGAGVLTGTIMASDPATAPWIQGHASSATNQLSKIVTPFGSWAAFATSGALVVSGIAFKETRLTTMGREALEACILAGLMTDIAKPVFGRYRPYQSDNETIFKPFSSYQSFPSGHATEAFALASVVAARSEGWVIPTLSYTVASMVAYSRVNDKAHFLSDVVAGGLIGTTVGRFLVSRHDRAANDSGAPKMAEVTLFALPGGLGVAAKF
jgi:membrane-associated phospholipid phosphatase